MAENNIGGAVCLFGLVGIRLANWYSSLIAM